MEYIEYVQSLSDDKLCEAVCHPCVPVRVLAIIEIGERGLRNEQVKAALEKAENDHTHTWRPITISMFASAELDHLGIKPYQGDDDEVRRLTGLFNA